MVVDSMLYLREREGPETLTKRRVRQLLVSVRRFKRVVEDLASLFQREVC